MNLRRFILKGALIDIKTKEAKLLEIEIEGTSGSQAVWAYQNKLKEEGKYTLSPDYTYFETGVIKVKKIV